jgi:hypothetical protein
LERAAPLGWDRIVIDAEHGTSYSTEAINWP